MEIIIFRLIVSLSLEFSLMTDHPLARKVFTYAFPDPSTSLSDAPSALELQPS